MKEGAWVGTLVVGGLAALDGTPVAQTLASQPLVTATILGALWGEAWNTVLRQPTSASTGCDIPARSRKDTWCFSQGRPQVR